MTNQNGVLAAAVVAACVGAFGCATDFGNAGEFLACDAKGKCANEYTCAKTELGAVCMSKAQFKERCDKPESCNGADDNCNGMTDEGFDGTGQPCDVGIGACAATGVTVCAEDGSAVICSAVPGTATDESCDGFDNNCDGTTDEAFADLGASCEVGIGACAATGITVCAEDGSMTACDAVSGLPADETCNGLDDDCDKEIDEGIADVFTGTDEGACLVRIESCVDGVPTVIQEGVEPTDEACNLVDDDCDSATDDSVAPELRGFAIGECRLYVAECVNGERVVTQVGVDPVDEICDHRDNNCDGQTDEIFMDLGESCAVGIGECLRTGTWVCASDFSPSSEGERCSAAPGYPTAELCDGLDNNCDGAVDETFIELGEYCSMGVGACRATGDRVCRDDTFGTKCDAETLEPTTETCDGEDNDCNGQIDDGLGDACCIPGTNHACGINLGACTVGTQSCSQDRQWGACSGQQPVTETCDGADNNCDGAVDEDLANCCSVGATVACSITRGACVAGQQLCTNERMWDTCNGVLPQSEICDGADNDCDGQTDEDWPNVGQTCNVGRGACAASGTMECAANHLFATCSVTAGSPTDESCNLVDDNCNGEIDEGLVQRQGTNIGECQEGIKRCVAGEYVPVQDLIESADEVCDGLDNDCDGAMDEDAPDCCVPGSVRTCGLNRGVCSIGSQSCGSDRAWSECSGALPKAEQCNDLDDNCDGQTDEVWTSLLNHPCTVDRGICARTGVWECNPDFSPHGEGEREGVSCTATPEDPGTEICDGLDNDCDGWADEIEDLPPVVEGSDIGVCDPSVSVCRGGQMFEVRSARNGSPEVCDGLDNNCDTFTDNGIESVPCYDGPVGTEDVGICFGGNTMCVQGTTICAGERIPELETCNNEDDDCDGVTDGWSGIGGGNPDPITSPCYTADPATLGIGQCHAGTTTCSTGRWGACRDEIAPFGLHGGCGSCKGLRDLGFDTDGVYTIALGTESIEVYCDMTIDGGGWTLVLAYQHPAGANEPLVIGTPPTNPDTGYSHMSTTQLQFLGFSELRFYCETSAHERKIHFKTGTRSLVEYVNGVGDNAVAYWTSNYTVFPDHTGNLPVVANGASIRSGDDRLTEFPFYRYNANHWSLHGSGDRWECDDVAIGSERDTLHLVLAR